MTGYKRQISYLDHLVDGEKEGNAGFVKAEEDNGWVRIEVKVKNLPASISGEFRILEEGGGKLGRISLNRGAGSCCMVWEGADEARGTWVQGSGLLIELPGDRMLKTVWKEPVRMPVQREAPAAQAIEYPELKWRDAEELFGPEIRINSAGQEDAEGTGDAAQTAPERRERETAETTEAAETTEPAEAAEPVEATEPAEAAEPVEATEPAEAAETADSACRGDKWEQLCAMYPLIHPFGDGRGYLSVAPKDFVVLRQEYQKMVHNSFLLHGYYNYRHLILGRLEKGGSWQYYLGVPGNFYHREKMVAEMFGFEAFEGGKESAAPGDFGYFMKRVEI